MSVHIASACKKLDYRGAKREVLLEFADHANDDGICWPSRSRIMYNTGLSESTVKKQVRELKEAGVIVVMEHREGGRGKVPIYMMHPEKGPQKAPFSEWYEKHAKGVDLEQKGSIENPKGVTQLPPEPSENRHIEPSISPRAAEAAQEPVDNSDQIPPAKTMTTLTIDRCREVGFDPAKHQVANWGRGWSKYLYVPSGQDPPEPEEAHAVLSEIVAAAAGNRGKGRYWISVQDALSRVRGQRDGKHAARGVQKKSRDDYDWFFNSAPPTQKEGKEST